MTKDRLFNVALAVVLALGPAVPAGTAQSQTLPFEFKAVHAANASNLLSAQIVVPDRSSYDGLRRVSESTVFHNHERFRLQVQPQQNGHIYVFSRDSSGDFQLLYPAREDGDNYVHRNSRLNLPGNGWFRFDEDPGREELILIQSPAPLAVVEQAAQLGDGIAADLLENYERGAENTIVRHIFLEHQDR
jgi:hypothetical protein